MASREKDATPYSPGAGLTEALNPNNARDILLAVLKDTDALATRLDRVAERFTALDHSQRLYLGLECPDLINVLLDVEHYAAARRGVAVRVEEGPDF